MEKVLVVATKALEKYIQNSTGMIEADRDEIVSTIIENHSFMPRPEAEQDPSFRQIIPYVILRQGDKIFTTRRLNKGGEQRLHGKMSIGIGGHINPVDEKDREKVLMRGLERELNEEVSIEKRGELRPLGVINDDSNEVGSVHLGLCFEMYVEGRVMVKETEKLEGLWLTVPELMDSFEYMETWTQIAVKALYDIEKSRYELKCPLKVRQYF